MLDIKTITAVAGTILCFLGFIYGLLKDRQVREIEKRSKAPHFIAKLLQIDAFGKSIPQGSKPYYNYREEASEIDDRLFEMEPYEKSVPDDYPDNRMVSLVVKNVGSKIRFYQVECHSVVFYKRVLMNNFMSSDIYSINLKLEEVLK